MNNNNKREVSDGLKSVVCHLGSVSLIGLMIFTVFACAVSLESKIVKAQVVTDTFDVNPSYKPMAFSIDKALWLKRNWGYIFALFIILLFGSIIYYGYKQGK